MSDRAAFLGFGEAAAAFAMDGRWSCPATGYDLKLDAVETRDAKIGDFERAGVRSRNDCASAVAGADLILSLVTADQSLTAARTAADHLQPDALYLDMNSVAPRRKAEAAEMVARAGGHYVDVAVMAPVHPEQLGVPLLISGQKADVAEQHLRSIGFSNVRQVGTEIGLAAVIKMVRSVMVKGIEALTAECVLAADSAGVTDEVLGSLGSDWSSRANYNLERMLVHGGRRAAEMEEVCMTLEDLGVSPALTRGTVSRQRELGAYGNSSPPTALADKLALINKQMRAHAR